MCGAVPILILCESCGSEGRVYVREDYYDPLYGWQPGERDIGECTCCEGRGTVLIEGEPLTLEDLEAA